MCYHIRFYKIKSNIFKIMSHTDLGHIICRNILNLSNTCEATCIEKIDKTISNGWQLIYNYAISYDTSGLPSLLNRLYAEESYNIKRMCICEYACDYYGSSAHEYQVEIESAVNRLTLTDVDLTLCSYHEYHDSYDLCRSLNLPKIRTRTHIKDELCRYCDDDKLYEQLNHHTSCKIRKDRSLHNIMLAALSTSRERSQKEGALKICALYLHSQLQYEGLSYDQNYLLENCEKLLEYTNADSFKNREILDSIPEMPNGISYKEEFAHSLYRRRHKNNYLRHIEWNVLRVPKLNHHEQFMVMDQYEIPTHNDLAFVPHNEFEHLLQEDICELLMSLLTNEHHKKQLLKICRRNRNITHAILAAAHKDGQVDESIIQQELNARGY